MSIDLKLVIRGALGCVAALSLSFVPGTAWANSESSSGAISASSSRLVYPNYQTAYDAFLDGEYDAAINWVSGALEATPEDVQLNIFAAEVIAARIITAKDDNVKTSAKQAREYAQLALRSDPTNQEALLQLAISDGIVTRSSSVFTVIRKKLGEKSLAHITDYRAAYPDDPRGLALLGAWHLGVVQRGGKKRARKSFGATVKEGRALYEEALKANPSDIVMQGNYIIGLASVAKQHPEILPDIAVRLESFRNLTRSPAKLTGLERDISALVTDVTQVMEPEALLDGAKEALGL